MKRPIPALLTLMALTALACSVSGGATPTTVPSTASAVVTAEVVTPPPPTLTALPSGSGPCEAQGTTDITVYERPSLSADEFGTLSPGMPVTLGGRTADGWLGFDPGVAQAANIGVFRLRWIPPEMELTLSGDCASVPVEPWVPEPGVCYQMSMGPVDVFPAPDPSVAAAAMLNVGDFAAVDGRVASGWFLVNGLRANTPDVFGFIKDTDANLNGPCESVPEITP